MEAPSTRRRLVRSADPIACLAQQEHPGRQISSPRESVFVARGGLNVLYQQIDEIRMARAYGSGSIREIGGSYYGRWYVDGKQVEKVIGPARKPGSTEGLTKTMAEARLRTHGKELKVAPVVERLTVEEVGARLIRQKRDLGREANTTESYESYLRVHIGPSWDQGGGEADEGRCRSVHGPLPKQGQSVKSTKNYLGLLHSICEYAIREGWASSNPASSSRSRELEDRRDPLPRSGRTQYVAEQGHARTRARPGRRPDVLHGRDDRASPGRAAGAALEGHRLGGAAGQGASELQPGAPESAQEQALLPERAAGRRRRRRA